MINILPFLGHNKLLFRTILQMVGVFAAYVAFSRLGYLLVIPPGKASVMWPSAGIALGCVYVLGPRAAISVFLACFTVAITRQSVVNEQTILLSLFVSLGVCLQSVLGAALVRRALNKEFYSGNLFDILRFMFWGGPVACICGGVIGSLTLLYVGFISADMVVASIFSWWLGDIFGVIVFAPLTVIFVSRRQSGQRLSLKTKSIVIIPSLIFIFVFTWVFISTKNELINHSLQEQKAQFSILKNRFSKVLSVDFAHIIATSAFIESSESVTAQEFRRFTRPLLENSTGLYGISWLPEVRHDDRDGFVQSIRVQGFPNFDIQARESDGSIIKSPDRDIYYPLAYTEPYYQNKTAHGFDVYGVDGVSGDVRRQILDDAKRTGLPSATSRFSIVQKQDEYGFIVYKAVYAPYALDERSPGSLIGYVNGIYIFPDLVADLFRQAKSLGTDIVLEQISSASDKDVDPVLLFDSRTDDFKLGPAETYDFSQHNTTQYVIDIPGQVWRLSFIEVVQRFDDEYIKSLWFLSLGGAVFSVLLLIILMTITARNDFIENLILARTRELKLANEELEEFAYRTSHDLRSPIVSSVRLLDIAGEAIHQGNQTMAGESIAHARKSLGKLEHLILDILTLTEIGSKNEEEAPFDILKAVDESIDKLSHADGFERLSIIEDIQITDEILTKPSRFRLILENLISNAAKYQDHKKPKSILKITCFQDNQYLILEVSDNGLGIPQDYRGELFEMFKRFHPKVATGSGLGLYLMKKSANILDGDIFYEPLEDGSLFRFKMPIYLA